MKCKRITNSLKSLLWWVIILLFSAKIYSEDIIKWEKEIIVYNNKGAVLNFKIAFKKGKTVTTNVRINDHIIAKENLYKFNTYPFIHKITKDEVFHLIYEINNKKCSFTFMSTKQSGYIRREPHRLIQTDKPPAIVEIELKDDMQLCKAIPTRSTLTTITTSNSLTPTNTLSSSTSPSTTATLYSSPSPTTATQSSSSFTPSTTTVIPSPSTTPTSASSIAPSPSASLTNNPLSSGVIAGITVAVILSAAAASYFGLRLWKNRSIADEQTLNYAQIYALSSNRSPQVPDFTPYAKIIGFLRQK